MKADAATEREISAAITRMVDAYGGRDMEALSVAFAPDDDVVMYGTGADERRVGLAEIRAQSQRDWDQSDAIAMRFDSQAISAAGDVAWAALDGAFEVSAGGQSMEIPARVSVIFENREGRWLVVHAHFSMPAAGQAEGESF